MTIGLIQGEWLMFEDSPLDNREHLLSAKNFIHIQVRFRLSPSAAEGEEKWFVCVPPEWNKKVPFCSFIPQTSIGRQALFAGARDTEQSAKYETNNVKQWDVFEGKYNRVRGQKGHCMLPDLRRPAGPPGLPGWECRPEWRVERAVGAARTETRRVFVTRRPVSQVCRAQWTDRWPGPRCRRTLS